MTNIADFPKDKDQRVSPLNFISPAEWQGKPIPAREWFMTGVAIRGGITLLNGEGGVGKSLLCMQLQTALALGKPWLSLPTPISGTRSLGLYCEDDPDELQRRQAEICRYYHCEMRDLHGLVTMMSRVGESNALMRFSRRDAGGDVTNLFRQIDATIITQKIEVIIVDTAADVFSGLEIDREQVRVFVQRLRTWAFHNRGSVILTQHPSLSGMQSGSGSSGSTGWHNSVRSRLYLTAPKRTDDDGDETPTDERTLKCMKSNYGPKNAKIRLVWKNGVFVPVSEVGPQSIFDAARTREMLVDAAEKFIRQGIELSADPQAKGSLIGRCRSHADLGKVGRGDLMRAQEKLIEGGKLVVVTVKKKDRHKGALIRPSFVKYPNEEEGNP